MQNMIGTTRNPDPSAIARQVFNLQGQTGSSGHPSPTDSDPKASSDSTGLPDTHSESSDVSPTSPQSDRAASNGSGTQNHRGDPSNDAPQDLSMKNRKGPVNDTSYENGGPLALKCSECGCLFESESLLKMHIQETHSPGLENGLSAIQQYANATGLQYDQAVMSFRDPRPEESAAVASLLSLQQLHGHMAADPGAMDAVARNTVIQNGSTVNGGDKIFNREAYCDVCNKEFCNKYYLQTHKATKHNIPAVSASGKPTLGRNQYGSMEDMDTHISASVPQEIAVPKPQHATMASSTSRSPEDDQLRCPFCGQQCANPYQLQSHVITLHSSQSPASILGSQQAQAAAIQALYAAQIMGAANSFAAANPFATSMTVDKMRALMNAGMIPPPGSGSPAGTPTPGGFGGIPGPIASPLEAYIQGQNAAAAAAASGFGFGAYTSGDMGSLTSGLPVVSSAGMGMAPTTPEGQSIRSTPSVNKEAYCELCRKEFCNKYFLRTHKMKKHGIQMDDSPTHMDGPPRKRPYGSLSLDSHDSTLPTMVSLNGASSFHNSQPISVSDVLLQPPEPKRSPLSEALLKPPVVLPRVSETEKVFNGAATEGHITPKSEPGIKTEEPEIYTSAGLSLEKLLASSQEQPSSKCATSATTNQALFCNICSRSFPSVFGLVAHKYRDHAGAGVGMDTTPLPPSFSSGMKLQSTPQKDRSLNDAPLLEAVDPEAYCELCQKEFCSKYFLKTHRMNIHGIADTSDTPPTGGQGLSAGMASSPSKVSATINAVLESTIGIGSQSPHSNGSPSLLGRGEPTPSGLSASGGGQRPRYVTGKNFCDICNKEVCNKYFLRTHMLKMHGIVIDENKTVIGNINTVDKEKLGSLLFRCDLCFKELSSRHFLKIHKMNIHGVVDTGSSPGPAEAPTAAINPAPPNVTVSTNGGPPSSSLPESPDKGMDPQDFYGTSNVESYKEVCPMCDRRFKSLKWLKSHILMEHGMGLSGSEGGSGPNSGGGTPVSAVKSESMDVDVEGESEPKLNITSKCEYCGANFRDVIQLQLHIIGQHAVEVHGRTRSLAESMALTSFFPQTQEPLPPHTPPAEAPLTPSKKKKVGDENKQSPPMMVTHNGTRLYRCSYCHYYTKWLSNLSVHERRHTGEAPKEEKPFVCNICLRAYRYAHSLERHREVHKYSSNASLQFFNGLKSPEKSLAAAGLNESVESGPGTEAGTNATEYAAATQKQATGAKRFRCTKCQKVFKSRELCRSHLYAVHRRQEIYRPEMGPMSPTKALGPVGQESPNTVKAAIRSIVNHITSQVSETKKKDDEVVKDPISQVVEAVHTELTSPGQPATDKDQASASQSQDEAGNVGAAYPVAFAQPAASGAREGQPYMIQQFKMSLRGIRGQNGGRTPFFEDMTVYLPVCKRVQDVVEVFKVSLEPAANSENNIISV